MSVLVLDHLDINNKCLLILKGYPVNIIFDIIVRRRVPNTGRKPLVLSVPTCRVIIDFLSKICFILLYRSLYTLKTWDVLKMESCKSLNTS